jgi:integrase
MHAGTLSADRGVTVRVAAEQFIAGIESGGIRNRSGGVYKPSAVRGIRRELNNRVVVAFGASYLREVTLPDAQRWADSLAREGLAPSTVRNVVNAMRSLYAWALPRGMATLNPTAGLRLPAGGKLRNRIATPSEARTLIAAVDPCDQAALGLAVYAGLRLGEVLALDWSRIDLDDGRLGVERAWDHGALEFVAPKSEAGIRTVPGGCISAHPDGAAHADDGSRFAVKYPPLGRCLPAAAAAVVAERTGATGHRCVRRRAGRPRSSSPRRRLGGRRGRGGR